MANPAPAPSRSGSSLRSVVVARGRWQVYRAVHPLYGRVVLRFAFVSKSATRGHGFGFGPAPVSPSPQDSTPDSTPTSIAASRDRSTMTDIGREHSLLSGRRLGRLQPDVVPAYHGQWLSSRLKDGKLVWVSIMADAGDSLDRVPDLEPYR